MTKTHIDSLEAELAEAQADMAAMEDIIAELVSENRALKGQLALKHLESTYDLSVSGVYDSLIR